MIDDLYNGPFIHTSISLLVHEVLYCLFVAVVAI